MTSEEAAAYCREQARATQDILDENPEGIDREALGKDATWHLERAARIDEAPATFLYRLDSLNRIPVVSIPEPCPEEWRDLSQEALADALYALLPPADP